MKIKNLINLLLILGLVFPSFGFAQGAQVPETLGEAKSFGMRILAGLPETIKDVWQNEALPFLQKTWEWVQNFWNTYIWSKIEPWWQKFLGLIGKEVEKRKPGLEEEFQKEKEEMKEEMKEELPKVGKPLWERFKDLLK